MLAHEFFLMNLVYELEFFLYIRRPTDSSKTTMDVSKVKVDTDARNTFNQSASGNSSSSSSGNDSPDLPSRASRSGRLQALSKFSKTAVTKGTTSSTITEAASTMLNVAQNENDKPTISTTNASSNEEEPQEIPGRIS